MKKTDDGGGELGRHHAVYASSPSWLGTVRHPERLQATLRKACAKAKQLEDNPRTDFPIYLSLLI